MASPETPLLTRVALAANWSAAWLVMRADSAWTTPAGITDDLCGKNGWAGRRRAMRRIAEGLQGRGNQDLLKAARLLAADPADPIECREIAAHLGGELSQHNLTDAAANAIRGWTRLADGFGNPREEDPIKAAHAAAMTFFAPSMPDGGEQLIKYSNTAPASTELATAAILDDWEWIEILGANEWCVRGLVFGSKKFIAGQVITTSAVSRTNFDRTWIRTRNSVYRLGYRLSSRPPIVRAALKKTWTDAFRLLTDITGMHTLPADINIALQAAEIDWPSRHGTAHLVAEHLRLGGRSALASAWGMLATPVLNSAKCMQVHFDLLEQNSDDVQPIATAWQMMSNGLTLDENLVDPIAAAHRIGDRHARNDALLAPDDGVETPAAEPLSGIVVLPVVGGTTQTTAAKEAQQEFKAIAGKRIPLAKAPDVARARRVLHDEFPHACAQIDVLLSGMAEGEPIRWRSAIIVGPSGGGKSRLARRLAEELGANLHRVDGAAASDNAFGGTPRRWSSGQHCTPLEAVRKLGVANPLLLIDEIDKAGTSQHNGSLGGALLPFLDVETSRAYPDKYVDSELDLSYVGFLLTCNSDAELAEPLRDRLLVVRLPKPGIEHLPALTRAIAAELGRAAGDQRWVPMLNDGELVVAEALWQGGSVRRLRAIVERIIAYRETNPRN